MSRLSWGLLVLLAAAYLAIYGCAGVVRGAPAPLQRQQRAYEQRPVELSLWWHGDRWDVRLWRDGRYRATWQRQEWVGTWRPCEGGLLRVSEQPIAAPDGVPCVWTAGFGPDAAVRFAPGGRCVR